MVMKVKIILNSYKGYVASQWKRTLDSIPFFFFQAEDGIRDTSVTGVQTCALPISISMGVSKSRLDGPVDELRIAGLIERTDWHPSCGQGYQLTPAGEEIASTPRLLDRKSVV